MTKSLTRFCETAKIAVLINKENKMNINLGKLDIIARFVLGSAAIAGGGYMAFIEGNTYGLAAAFAGAILMVTGLMKWCPMYAIFGLSSCPLSGEKR